MTVTFVPMLLPFSLASAARLARPHVVGAAGLVMAAGLAHPAHATFAHAVAPAARTAVSSPAASAAPNLTRASVSAQAAAPAAKSAVAATLPSSAAATGGAYTPVTTAQSYAASIFSLVNSERVANGRKALAASSCLQGFATPWAAHLASIGGLAHQNLGPFLSDCHASSAAENVGMGNVSASGMESAFWASPDHKANILSSSSTHLAVAAYEKDGTWYVVQDFYG